MMEIEFLDREARLAATLPGERPPGWSDAEVARLRLIVQCVRAGVVADDVLALRSLRLRPLDRDGRRRHLAELSADRAVAVTFTLDGGPASATLDIIPARKDART